MKMNMQSIMQQAQKMQEEMEKVKNEINNKTVTEEAGGGMVKVTMAGNHQVRSIKIDPEIIDSEDPEMLEDLIVAAVNKAAKSVEAMSDEEMKKVTGMMPNIPGMNLGL